MIFTGWFLVNILGPVFLPVFGILPLWLLPLGLPSGTIKIMKTVKDGQLCWAVIAMGASTVYEIWEALASQRAVPAWAGFVFALAILLMLTAMVIAACGAVFSTPLPEPAPQGLKAWLTHYKVFAGSLVMTLLAATIYTKMHFALST